MKYIILLIIIFCATVYGNNPPPQIDFTETEFDFGELNQNMEVTHIFKFRNTGMDTLVIKNVRTSCGCTASAVALKIVAPQDSSEIKVTFRTGKFKDAVTKTIIVESNDPTNPAVYLRIKATVMPEIKCFFFYSQESKESQSLLKDIFPSLKQKYNLYIKFLDLSIQENYELFVKIKEKYKYNSNKMPVIVIGTHILTGKKEIKQELENLLLEYRQTGCEFTTTETKSDTTATLPQDSAKK